MAFSLEVFNDWNSYTFGRLVWEGDKSWSLEVETLKNCIIQKCFCPGGMPSQGRRVNGRTILYLGREKEWNPAQSKGGESIETLLFRPKTSTGYALRIRDVTILW